MRDEPARYPQQYARIMAADCAFPIHLAPYRAEADLEAMALQPPGR